MDPVLEYLLDFNKQHEIEYQGRYIIPRGGLTKMLAEFQGFRLNREEIVKPLLVPDAPESLGPQAASIEDLYKLLD